MNVFIMCKILRTNFTAASCVVAIGCATRVPSSPLADVIKGHKLAEVPWSQIARSIVWFDGIDDAFCAPGLSENISGVILHSMLAGIKVDKAYNKKGMWGTGTDQATQ